MDIIEAIIQTSESELVKIKSVLIKLDSAVREIGTAFINDQSVVDKFDTITHRISACLVRNRKKYHEICCIRKVIQQRLNDNLRVHDNITVVYTQYRSTQKTISLNINTMLFVRSENSRLHRVISFLNKKGAKVACTDRIEGMNKIIDENIEKVAKLGMENAQLKTSIDSTEAIINRLNEAVINNRMAINDGMMVIDHFIEDCQTTKDHQN